MPGVYAFMRPSVMLIPKQGVCYHTARRLGSYSVTVPKRPGIEQDDLHGSILAFELWSMGAHLVDASHPLFIGRIIGTVGDLLDFAQTASSRFDVLTMLFFRHEFELPIGPPA